MDELGKLGFRSVPVTVISEKAIVGFNPQKFAEALKLGIKTTYRDPSETIPLIERVLEAGEEAVRQMPNEKLDWTAPDRDRPMREFAYHIFRIVPQYTLDELIMGVLPGISDVPRCPYNNFQDIADYGRTVIEQYRFWARKQDLNALHMSPPAGPSSQSGAECLDLIAGHVIQHLRQLYSILDNFGIEPKNRLQDSDLPPEYVLTILW